MSILQRKAQVGKQEHQARAMTLPKALRVGLAKVADVSLNLALVVIGVSQEKCGGDELSDKLTDDGLLLLLDGPMGSTAGAVLDSALVTALVQQQTTGRVSKAPVSDRALTETDAALCGPTLDALFVRANALLDTPEEKSRFPCFKFGARAENARLFNLALDASEYHLLRVTIDVAAGIAQSTMTLILPVQDERLVVHDETSPTVAPKRAATLEASVMGLRADISAVLCRMRMPLSTMSRLRPGDVLPVPTDAFDSVELLTIEGRLLGRGTMGQIEGYRALMMSSGAGSPKSARPESGTSGGPVEEASDYTNLGLQELDMSSGPDPILPTLDDELPDLPALDGMEEDYATGFDLPDLPDLPDFDQDFPELDDLPKINIA